MVICYRSHRKLIYFLYSSPFSLALAQSPNLKKKKKPYYPGNLNITNIHRPSIWHNPYAILQSQDLKEEISQASPGPYCHRRQLAQFANRGNFHLDHRRRAPIKDSLSRGNKVILQSELPKRA